MSFSFLNITWKIQRDMMMFLVLLTEKENHRVNWTK